MTYCYIFNAEPDGIGVVADGRLTYVTSLGETTPIPGESLKIYSPAHRVVVVIAGKVDHVSSILYGCHEVFKQNESTWFDGFIKHCENNYKSLWNSNVGLFSSKDQPEAEIIYGDVRHRKGRNRCRIVRMSFTVSRGQPHVVRKTATNGEWVAIGWHTQGRRELSKVASGALSELESRSLQIRAPTPTELAQIPRNKEQESYVRVFDTQGPRDGTFRKTFRKCANQLSKNKPAILAFGPVMIYSAVAAKAIEQQMAQMKATGSKDAEMVGDKFYTASLTQREGLRVFNADDMQAINTIVKSLM